MTTVLWVASIGWSVAGSAVVAGLYGLRDRYQVRPHHARFDTDAP